VVANRFWLSWSGLGTLPAVGINGAGNDDLDFTNRQRNGVRAVFMVIRSANAGVRRT